MTLGDMAEWFELRMLLQLVLALVLGAAVGLERELRGRSAGLRTMSIVCMGSTLIMIVSHELVLSGPQVGPDVLRVDPGRIAAGIVTGVGFLGAGVILKLGDLIRGVTTAACIWLVAALGLAIGQMQYALAVMATALALLVLWLLQQVERRMQSLIYRTVVIRARAERSADVLRGAQALIETPDTRVMDIRVSEDVEARITELELALRTRQMHQGHDVVKALSCIDGVLHARWS